MSTNVIDRCTRPRQPGGARWGLLAAVLGAWLIAPRPAPAQITSNWTNAAGGTFNVAGNWSAGVPGTLDTAFFNNVAPAYTVTFDNSPSNAAFNITSNMALTFTNSGGPQTYTISGTGSVSMNSSTSSLTLTGTGMNMAVSNASNTMTLSSGFVFNVNAGATFSVAKQFVLGSTAASTSTMNVDGVGSTLNATSVFNVGSISTTGNGVLNLTNGAAANLSTTLNVVNGANFINRSATVNVLSGSTLSVGNVSMGTSIATGNTSTLTVSGAGSTVTQTGTTTLTVGSTSATGTVTNLNVNSGGVYNTATGATTINTSGTINVGGGTFNQNGNMNIQGGGDFSLTSGTHNVAATRTINVTGAGSTYTHAGSSFTLNGGSVMTVQADADAVLNTTFNIGTGGSSGTFTVTGAGSTVVNTGTASVQVGANGVMNVNSSASFASGIGGFNIFGDVNVDGGTLTLNSLLNQFGTFDVTSGTVNLAASGTNAIQSGAVMTVTGGIVSVTGNLRLDGTLNAFGAGLFIPAANVTVQGGGNLTIANSLALLNQTLTVQHGGSLASIPGLTLGASGNVALSEGTLEVTSNGLTFNGGTMTWNTGTVRYNGGATLNGVTVGGLLAGGQVLGAGKHLEVLTTATLQTPMTLAGGTFSAGSLSGGNLLMLNSGTLNITNSGVTVGSGGTLGSVVNVGNGMTINQTVATANTINGDGRLVLSGGTFNTTGTLTNNGEIQGTSSLATLGGTGTLVNNSTVLGTARIEKNLTNNAGGSIQAAGSDRLVFNGATNTNAGRIDVLNGGQVEFRQALTNAASTGLITGRDATLRFNGGLTNNGSLAFSNGTMDVFGDIQQNVGGRITVSGGGVLNFYDDVTIASGANSVQASAAGGFVSAAVFFGSYNGGIVGGGTGFIEGDHRPGNSPGLVSFGGDVFYGGLSTLHIEIGGLIHGSQYDRVLVAGDVTLQGALDVQHIGGFTPGFGQSFLILDKLSAGPITGFFTGLPEGGQLLVDGFEYTITYQGGNGNDIVLSAVPEPGTWALLGFSLMGGSGWWWRRRQQRLENDSLPGDA